MKDIIDYEVEGCWTNKKITPRCRLCGTKYEKVPRKGHYNSKYWELERNDGFILVCCPKNCNVIIAEKKYKEYLEIWRYCKDDSQSWNYELDYNRILHAWIDRQGKIYPLEIREHISFVEEHNTEEIKLENKGWLKLSSKDFYWEKKLSKRQIDIIFDYIMVVGTDKDVVQLQNCIDNETGCIKLGD